jgi:MFS transporter, PPP family, 3-phenylpropionic acid transporter
MPARTASSLALSSRYAVMYGAVFLTIGIYLPFWPVWLSSRGFSAGEIGLLLALGTWVKVFSNPVMAQVADRSGRAKATLVACAALTLLSFSAFSVAEGFWPILAIMLLVNLFHPVLIPLAETQTMAAANAGKLDYGRVRLWGSLTFILGTVGAGWVLTGRGPDLILALILGALGLNVLAAMIFPGSARTARPSPRGGLWVLFTRGRFLLFLGAASLLSASHAVYYGFSALHWRAAGLSEATVGWLWAVGVIAEVVLFAFSARIVARLGPFGLLAVAGFGGVVRWLVLGGTTVLPALAAAQLLHAATFGAAHLGAMHFLARNAPPGLAASAQALYSAVAGGIAIGAAMLASGWLYAEFGGGAFTIMAVLSALGGLLALALMRREPGKT